MKGINDDGIDAYGIDDYCCDTGIDIDSCITDVDVEIDDYVLSCMKW